MTDVVWMLLVPKEGLVPPVLVGSIVMVCDSKVLLVVPRISFVENACVVALVNCDMLGDMEMIKDVEAVPTEDGGLDDDERSIILTVLILRLFVVIDVICSVVLVCVLPEVSVPFAVTIVDNAS